MVSRRQELEQGKTCVMVVDDDREVRDMLRLALEQVGYMVEDASNGAEALERLHGGLRPSLILLDLMMPTMTGWEFRDAMVRDPSLGSMPVVVLSAVERLEDAARAMGGLEFVSKPISIRRLLKLVGRYCGEANDRDLCN
jgi:CheY-like chemotaxis protein